MISFISGVGFDLSEVNEVFKNSVQETFIKNWETSPEPNN
jgi:hypothetical protein